MKILSESQSRLEEIILNNNGLLPLSSLSGNEIKNLATKWTYYSGQIEGNTYTYVETEALLSDGITATKSYEEA